MKKNNIFLAKFLLLLSCASTQAMDIDVDDIEIILDKRVSFAPGHFSQAVENEKILTHPYQPETPCEQRENTYEGQLKTLPSEKVYQEKILMRIKQGEDGRKRVTNPSNWPYVFQGQLSLHFSDGEYGGSGVLVGPQQLLTAGHNVYSHKAQEWVKKIVLHLALNENLAPFGENYATKIYTFKSWINKEDYSYDLALVVFDRPIGLQTGWCGILPIEDKELLTQKVNVTGYPGDKGFKQMWTMAYTLKASTPDQLFYDIDTYGGQSGSGVWIERSEKPYVVGIHTLGEGPTESGNSGVRLSAYKVNKIIQWIQDSMILDKNLPSSLLQFTEENVDTWFRQAILGDETAIQNLQYAANESNTDVKYFFEQYFRKHTAKTKQFFSLIGKNISPFFLNLSHLNICDEDVVNLVGSLKFNTCLQELDLSNNQIGNAGLKTLATLLYTTPHLTSMNVENNNIWGEEIKPFADAVAKSTTLKSLKMGLTYSSLLDSTILKMGDVISWHPHQSGSTLIGQLLKQNSSLTAFSLEKTAIGDEGTITIFNALENNPRLTFLSLCDNFICDKGIQNFPKLQCLSNIDLSSNNITDASINSLFKFFPEHSIKTIILKRNKLDKIATKIAPMLQRMNVLQLLDVSENSIGDQSAKEFITVLQDLQNPKFSLDLRQNKISNSDKHNLNLLKIKHKDLELFL